ncbi:hypothetical protein ARSEF4850_007017 [Beauveria asiatica]
MSLDENADCGSFHDSEDIETPDFFEENCNEVSLQGAKYPSKADNKTFRSLVLKASNDMPEELKNVCHELSIIAEHEAANNSSPDDILKSGLRDCVKECLLRPK